MRSAQRRAPDQARIIESFDAWMRLGSITKKPRFLSLSGDADRGVSIS